MTSGKRLIQAILFAVLLALPAAAVQAQGPAAGYGAATPQADPFIDRGTVMGACGVGVAWGAISLATYPLWKWAKDAGAILSMGVMAWRGVLGCYYGIIAGVTISAASSSWNMLQEQWFSTPEGSPVPDAATPPAEVTGVTAFLR